MRILPAIARLKAQCALLNNRVYSAGALTAVDDAAAETPAAYVHPWTEEGAENALGNETPRQLVTDMFAVQVVAAPADVSAGTDQLEDVRDQIKVALVGWQGEYQDVIEFVRGDVLDVNAAKVWWRDIYRVSRWL